MAREATATGLMRRFGEALDHNGEGLRPLTEKRCGCQNHVPPRLKGGHPYDGTALPPGGGNRRPIPLRPRVPRECFRWRSHDLRYCPHVTPAGPAPVSFWLAAGNRSLGPGSAPSRPSGYACGRTGRSGHRPPPPGCRPHAPGPPRSPPGDWSVSSAAQSRELERKPCGTAAISVRVAATLVVCRRLRSPEPGHVALAGVDWGVRGAGAVRGWRMKTFTDSGAHGKVNPKGSLLPRNVIPTAHFNRHGQVLT